MQQPHRFLRRQANYEDLYFYKKTVVLYQLTFAFTKRFLKVGDRTIDQMVQAARSGKQNIVEGSADGVSSTEMEIKLINVARASIKELKEDSRITSLLATYANGMKRIPDSMPRWTFVASIMKKRITATCTPKPRTRNWQI